MASLGKELKAVSKTLKSLSQKTEKMIKALDKLEKKKTAKKPKKKVAAKAKPAKKATARKAPRAKGKGMTATEAVLKVISRSKKGVDTAKLKARTGFNDKKIWDAVYRLSKQGQIKKAGKGAYLIAK